MEGTELGLRDGDDVSRGEVMVPEMFELIVGDFGEGFDAQTGGRAHEIVLEDEIADELAALGGVDDLAVLAEAEDFGKAIDDAHAQAVEGVDVQAIGDGPGEEAGEAGAELLGGLGGEGDGEDVLGENRAGGDGVGDAVNDDAGFAGAGAGENDQGATVVHDGGFLGVVETVEQIGHRELCEVRSQAGTGWCEAGAGNLRLRGTQ